MLYPKRALDLVASSAALAIVGPTIAAVAAVIKLDSRGPVFYRGERVGLNGKPFKIFKFRSMVVDAERLGGPSTSGNDSRVTRVGRFIRKYKLDELPQLINVLVGDMSLVGPRPEVKRYVDMYTEEEKKILSVRPGITDWASMKFHNEGEIIAESGFQDPEQAYMELIRPEKLRLQLKYVSERNVKTDAEILFRTFSKLVATRASQRSTLA